MGVASHGQPPEISCVQLLCSAPRTLKLAGRLVSLPAPLHSRKSDFNSADPPGRFFELYTLQVSLLTSLLPLCFPIVYLGMASSGETPAIPPASDTPSAMPGIAVVWPTTTLIKPINASALNC